MLFSFSSALQASLPGAIFSLFFFPASFLARGKFFPFLLPCRLPRPGQFPAMIHQSLSAAVNGMNRNLLPAAFDNSPAITMNCHALIALYNDFHFKPIEIVVVHIAKIAVLFYNNNSSASPCREVKTALQRRVPPANPGRTDLTEPYNHQNTTQGVSSHEEELTDYIQHPSVHAVRRF